ncbi:cupin domain-containing protein [Proteiniphilum sp.]|uniref:cupin domain-containing protein n=1 Tax=Proteiniphilum sp. TaxID=1926877 RepID=UPI00332327DB
MATYEKSTVIALEKSIDYASGGVVSKQVTKNKAGNITIFSFDKEQGLTEHTANYDAFVQILDGEAEIRIGGEPHLLKKGDCIIMPANIPHALTAVERFKMLLTMIRGEQ